MLNLTLSLVQAACALALEGTSRASVTAVVRRAQEDTGVQVMPSMAGQIFSSVGVRTVTSHGRNRLVLDAEELRPLWDRMAARWEEVSPQVEQYLSQFGELAERVEKLEARRQAVLNMIARDKSNREFLKKREIWVIEAQSWERSAQKLRETVARCARLKEECEELRKQVKTLPKLEKRQEGLEAKLAEYREEDEALQHREKELGEALENVRRRLHHLRTWELDRAVEKAEAELEALNEQLRDKRGRLARLLTRGGDPS